MTTRKVIHPLSPTSTTSAVRTLSSAMATEYAEAIQTLNEPTMKQACEWLLDDTEESEDKLLETYYKCESAWKVLQRQQQQQQNSSLSHQQLQTPLTPLPPGAPNLSLSAMSNNNSNNNAKGTAIQPRPLPKLGLGSVTATTGIIATNAVAASSSNPTTPTTSANGAGGAGGASPSSANSNSNTNTNSATMKVAKGGVIPMRRTAPIPKLSRMRSTEVSSSSDALDALQQSKKPRPDNARAPPPSALHFLAKLNKDAPGTSGPSMSGPSQPTATTTTPNALPRNLPPMKGQHHRRTSS